MNHPSNETNPDNHDKSELDVFAVVSSVVSQSLISNPDKERVLSQGSKDRKSNRSKVPLSHLNDSPGTSEDILSITPSNPLN